MNKLIKKTLALGFGISTITQEQVSRLTKEIMKKQGISEKQAKKLAKNLLTKSKKTQQKVQELVTNVVGNVFHTAGLATKKDIDDLKKEMKRKIR